MLAPTLRALRHVRDTGHLFAQLGYRPVDQPFDERATVVADWRGFRIVAMEDDHPPETARNLARRLGAASARGMAVVLHPGHELAIAAPRLGAPGVSRVLTVSLTDPPPHLLQHLAEFRPKPTANGLVHALRVDELLASEVAGERFFAAFRVQLERMSAVVASRATPSERRLVALLSLTRVLFLYFVQAKGWLDGRRDYLRATLDHALAREASFHRDTLDPLCFETLNRPVAQRSTARFGAVPYLNGGLFERHSIERRLGPVIFPNRLWRDAFEAVFGRFRFCVREAHEVDAIAPDMLGRVFERVMASQDRRQSGTYYTPESVVQQIVTATIRTALTGRAHLDPALVDRLLHGEPVEREHVGRVDTALRRLRVVDPAVGSGAFLLGALETLTTVHVALHDAPDDANIRTAVRRRILHDNLFGVDRNPIAVRLAELRLWLAVIADDPTRDVRAVEPLPNLTGVIRQGDSLLDPIGAAAHMGVAPQRYPRGLPRRVQRARDALFGARGASQRQTLIRLRGHEQTLALTLIRQALDTTRQRLSDLEGLKSSRDLFGRRVRLTPTQRRAHRRLTAHRAELHRVEARVREGEVPFFAFEVHAPDVTERGGFCAVIGNPPWVRAERLPPSLRSTLKERFSWWSAGPTRGFAHLPDLAVAFLQRALELTAPDGAVGFVIPSKVASAGYGQPARHHLVRETTLRYVHRVPDTQSQSFGATTYPLALVLSKTTPAADHRLALDWDETTTRRQATLAAGGPWVLVSDRVAVALERLGRAGIPLREFAAPALGVKTGANEVFVGEPIARTEDVCSVRFPGGTSTVEANTLRPVVRGRDVNGFRAQVSRVIVWPYDDTGRLLTRLPGRTRAHLRPHRSRLLARSDYDRGPWWKLFRLAGALAPHTVVWPDIALRPRAVVLQETRVRNAVPLNSCYASATGDRPGALLVAAVLNSSWTRALCRAAADEARGQYRRLNAAVIGTIPIPHPTPATDRVIALSAEAHKRERVSQAELDEAVACALDLPTGTQRALLHYLDHNG